MKKITLLALTGLFLSFTSCNKESEAPQKVKDAFATRFPAATNVKWDKEADKEWEAEFKLNGKEHSSNFMVDGAWVETEYEVSEVDIPQVVMATFKSNFAGYKIEEMELSETTDGKVYEFGIEKDDMEMEVAIDANGKIVKKEQKKDEDNEDGDNDDND